MSRPKVAVIGAGNVGATTAQRIADSGLADVVLTDIVEGMPQGKALDILEAAPVAGSPARVRGTNDLADIAGARVVVVTAGLPRKPGMSREDLLRANADIVGPIADAIRAQAPQAIVVVVSNPLDIMTQLTMKRTGFEPRRVVGMAGVLDAARFAAFIAMEIGLAPTDVRAMVLGGHGDAMVPLPRFSSVSGIPIPELITRERIEALIDRTRKGGGEIVNLLKTGSAYYAPSASVHAMVAAILRDEKRILPCAAYLDGQYGIRGVYCGVPVKLGGGGVEEIIQLSLTPEELKALRESAEVVREGVKTLGLI